MPLYQLVANATAASVMQMDLSLATLYEDRALALAQYSPPHERCDFNRIRIVAGNGRRQRELNLVGRIKLVKADLIQRIARRNPKLSMAECRQLIDTFYSAMIEHLAKGDAIELRGFGSFAIKRYDNRVVRNPRTGKITSKEHIVSVRFRAGKSLAALLNHT